MNISNNVPTANLSQELKLYAGGVSYLPVNDTQNEQEEIQLIYNTLDYKLQEEIYGVNKLLNDTNALIDGYRGVINAIDNILNAIINRSGVPNSIINYIGLLKELMSTNILLEYETRVICQTSLEKSEKLQKKLQNTAMNMIAVNEINNEYNSEDKFTKPTVNYNNLDQKTRELNMQCINLEFTIIREFNVGRIDNALMSIILYLQDLRQNGYVTSILIIVDSDLAPERESLLNRYINFHGTGNDDNRSITSSIYYHMLYAVRNRDICYSIAWISGMMLIALLIYKSLIYAGNI